MQSLQADQSLYNRKGVCYVSVFSVCCRYYSHYGKNGEGKFTTKSLILNTKILFIFQHRRKDISWLRQN
jgi:hypothetical protein